MAGLFICLFMCLTLCILDYDIRPVGYFKMNGVLPLLDRDVAIKDVLFQKLLDTKKEIELEVVVNSLKYDVPLDLLEGFIEDSKLQRLLSQDSSIIPFSNFMLSHMKDGEHEENVLYPVIDFKKKLNEVIFTLDKRFILRHLITRYLEDVLKVRLRNLPVKILSSDLFYDKLEKIFATRKHFELHHFKSIRTVFEYLGSKYEELSYYDGNFLYESLVAESNEQCLPDCVEFNTVSDIENVFKKVFDLMTLAGVVNACQNNESIQPSELLLSDEYKAEFSKTVAIDLKKDGKAIDELSSENLKVQYFNSKEEEILLHDINTIVKKGTIGITYCDIINYDIASLRIFYLEESTELISLKAYEIDATVE